MVKDMKGRKKHRSTGFVLGITFFVAVFLVIATFVVLYACGFRYLKKDFSDGSSVKFVGKVDGDGMMYILANRLKSRGMLSGNTVVATVMSNSGFFASLKKIGIDCDQTKVGDRFVYESMQNNDFSLGGEQSGHIILKKYATTGDGILTAIMIAEEMCDRKSSLGKLAEPVMLYPQHIVNVRVKDKAAVMGDSEVLRELNAVEQLINGNGRALLRQSGTEPVIRIMIESESMELCECYAAMIAKVIKERGHCSE